MTVFCEQADLEAFLRCETGFLDESAFQAELKRLRGKDIQFEFGCTPDRAFLDEKRASFDVVCCSAAVLSRLFPEAGTPFPKPSTPRSR